MRVPPKRQGEKTTDASRGAGQRQTAQRASAAAHEAPDGRHQLAGAGVLLGVGAIDDAVARVVVEQPQRDLVERGLDRGDLGQHIDAVAVLVDHALDAADLALDAAQALAELVLGGGVAARLGARRGHAEIIPPRGVRDGTTPPRGLDWRPCSLLPRWRRASRTVSSTPWPAPTPACWSLRSRSTCPRRCAAGSRGAAFCRRRGRASPVGGRARGTSAARVSAACSRPAAATRCGSPWLAATCAARPG